MFRASSYAGAVTRTWPFEDRPEPEEPFRAPEDFVARRGRCDAVVMRIGRGDAQLLLVDGDGRWERWVYASVDVAEGRARGLGVDVHVGSHPEEVRARMTDRVRHASELAGSPYPEQGRVGPVISYPENRPRPIPEEEEEVPPGVGLA
jgi:hypothetical protein